MSWSFWAKVHKGRVVDTLWTGEPPDDFAITVNGHKGNAENVGFSMSIEKDPDSKAKE